MCSQKSVPTCRRAAFLLALSVLAFCGLSCAPKTAPGVSRTPSPAASPPHPVLPRVAARPKTFPPIAFPDLNTNQISGLVFSPDGRHLAISYGTDAEVSLWNLNTGRLGWQRFVNAADGGPIQFGPNGRFLIAQFGDPDSTTPLIVSTIGGQLIRNFGSVYDAQIQHEGRFFVVSGRQDKMVLYSQHRNAIQLTEVWDTRTWRRIDHVSKTLPATVPLTAFGRIIRRAAAKKPVKPWQPPSTLFYNSASTAALNYLATTDAKTVEVWNVRSRKRLWRKTFADDTPSAPAVSPDGRTLAIGTLGGYVYFWNLKTGKLLARTHCATDVLRGLAFSPNGRVLAAGGGYQIATDGVRLLDMATFKVFAVLKVSLANTPDGARKDWSLNHPDWLASLPDLSYAASAGVVKKIRTPGRARDAKVVARFSRPGRVRAALRKCYQAASRESMGNFPVLSGVKDAED